MLKNVQKFICDNLSITPKNILNIEKINKGFTNEIFCVTLDDNRKFKVRFVNDNPYINRKLEAFIEKQLYFDDIYYYDHEGNFIKKWYDGHTITKSDLNDEVWEKLIKFINSLQSIKLYELDFEVTRPIFVLPNHIVSKELIKPLLAYKKIANENLKNNLIVLSHNDFSDNNIVITNDKNIVVMDYEWASYNHPYWDLANLIKHLELTYEEVLIIKPIANRYQLDLLVKVIYATHFYTYFWTYKVEETDKIVAYREEVIKMIHYWYRILKEKGLTHA